MVLRHARRRGQSVEIERLGVLTVDEIPRGSQVHEQLLRRACHVVDIRGLALLSTPSACSTRRTRAATPEGGSGFGGSADEWRSMRSMPCDAIDDDSTFLDVGCANGLLMESTEAWAGERGHAVEPFGIDISEALVAVARRRLPQWADRIWVGNSLTWEPPGRRFFDVVHVLLDLVPEQRHADLVAHLLDVAVRPGGRLLVSAYGRHRTRPARRSCTGPTRLRGSRGDPLAVPPWSPHHPPSAWIEM